MMRNYGHNRLVQHVPHTGNKNTDIIGFSNMLLDFFKSINRIKYSYKMDEILKPFNDVMSEKNWSEVIEKRKKNLTGLKVENKPKTLNYNKLDNKLSLVDQCRVLTALDLLYQYQLQLENEIKPVNNNFDRYELSKFYYGRVVIALGIISIILFAFGLNTVVDCQDAVPYCPPDDSPSYTKLAWTEYDCSYSDCDDDGCEWVEKTCKEYWCRDSHGFSIESNSKDAECYKDGLIVLITSGVLFFGNIIVPVILSLLNHLLTKCSNKYENYSIKSEIMSANNILYGLVEILNTLNSRDENLSLRTSRGFFSTVEIPRISVPKGAGLANNV